MLRSNSLHILQMASLFLKEAAKIEPVSTVLESPENLETMEKIDEQQFAKYPWGYSQDREDIQDDLEQPGANGFVLKDDDNKIVGYLYGYNFVFEDNWYELDMNDSSNEWFIPEEQITEEYQKVRNAAINGKIFYISNLAILPGARGNFLKLALALKKGLKDKEYQYISFGALSDSFRLITQGGPRFLKKMGLEQIFRRMEDEQAICLMKIV